MTQQHIPHETLRSLLGHKTPIGATLRWDGARWIAGPPAGGLFVSDLADGPPTDGSVFWYVTDESC